MIRFALSALFLIVAGCAAPANPPSLAPRAIESRTEVIVTTPPPAAPVSLNALVASKVAALVTEAKAGEVDFVKADQGGARAIAAARNASPGSEGWIDAELVRSVLQVARQRSAGALAEIDTLAIAQGQLKPGDLGFGGLDQIQTAQAEIESIVARQTARLAELDR